MRIFLAPFMALALLVLGNVHANASTAKTDNVAAQLEADVTTIVPGKAFNAVLKMDIRKHWHTYWLNPGDAGEPTRINWTLPEGVTAGDIIWPVPQTIALGPLINYGYKDEAVYIVPIQTSAELPAGQTLNFSAHITWLVCEDICIPEDGQFSFSVQTGPATIANTKWQKMAQKALAETAKPDASIKTGATLKGETLTYSFAGPGLGKAKTAYFFPVDTGAVRHAEPQLLSRGTDGFTLWTKPGFRAKRGLNDPIEGILTLDGKAISLSVQPGPAPAETGADTLPGAKPAATGPGALLQALLFAFIGGVILNLMPCVFPVLSMKAMGFVKRAHDHASEIRRHGVLFLVGVMVSFLALGGLLIALKASGQQIGWGFQLQYPPFVAALALLFFVLGLMLLGFMHFGGRFMGMGSELASSGGNTGAFFTGVLAVIVASPCTAPAMGFALGFTLTQGAGVTLAIFAALGLGFAAPFFALSFFPSLLRLLPKPGQWMVRFGQLMAFPMFAAAVWLVWVLDGQAGSIGVAAVLAAMTLIAFAIWAAKGERAGKITAAIAVLATVWVLWSGLNGKDTKGLEPQVWSPTIVQTLLAKDHVVFVDFTADWCITCQVNERVALSSKKVARAFKKENAVYVVADWTNRNDDIARELARHGRAGVPLYLVYHPGIKEPQVLPQILSEGMVINAIKRE
ncbi:MAG: thiol:disulfide interchange protein [Robiginitomaculum sp.]|nr:MAG: thiol:disulfide interchange protein [Robiginitomaculum sp.]